MKNLISIVQVIIILFSILSCQKGIDIPIPPSDPDPVDSTQKEPEENLPYANVFYPKDTSKGAMYAVKNNHPKKFVATCNCYFYPKEVPAKIYIGGSTSLDPWPRVYNYEIFTFGGYELNYNINQIPTVYYNNNKVVYRTLQHDTFESYYLLDTSYRRNVFRFIKLDTSLDIAEGEFNVQYKLDRLYDSTAVNPPSVIRLANGRFWCKLQRR
ncbi:MAG: hypothetical protein IPM48_05225 [Saprospiraceae bacterium]|nr:hypothetical protein [Saprospiraceae bacterium]